MHTTSVALRSSIKQQRRQLSRRSRVNSGRKLANRLNRLACFKYSNRIGLYLDAFGEIPTQHIFNYCFNQHKFAFLPVVRSTDQVLSWAHVTPQQYRQQRFYPHRLGMAQPYASRGYRCQTIDLLIMPLVVADHHGTRLGMGGGYYDRTLHRHPYRPYRLGIAYDFQITQQTLLRQAWDQPIDALLTPTQYITFRRWRH